MSDKARDLFWKSINNFEPHEFDDPRYPGSHKFLNVLTVSYLDDLRYRTGWPIITHNKFGLRGCVCVDHVGHSPGSLHYVVNGESSAVDFHFVTNENPRVQAKRVIESGFPRIGIYYDWHWEGKLLPVGFHVDLGSVPQIWKRIGGKYVYFLK